MLLKLLKFVCKILPPAVSAEASPAAPAKPPRGAGSGQWSVTKGPRADPGKRDPGLRGDPAKRDQGARG